MVSILDLIFGSIAAVGLGWYSNTFMIGLNQFPQMVLSFLLTYLVIQLFLFIFPPLRKLMMILGAPFRYMHVWLHVDTAKRIQAKKYGINTQNIPPLGVWGNTEDNDVNPLLHPYFTTKDALKIASAPLLGAIVLFIFIMISAPIFAAMKLFGLIFHLYLLFCCLGVAFPSIKDYMFLFKGNTAQANSIHPGYYLWIYFVFAFSGYLTLQSTGSAMAAFRDGILYSLIYVVLLSVVSKIGNKNTVKG